MQGLVFDIKKFAVHDGPGIRTTIFFKGCPLNCIWCHNPESIDKNISYLEKEVRISEKIYYKKEKVGAFYNSDDLMKEILKDELIFDESGGGITISGGEPLLQIDFLKKILRTAKQNAIHTAVDTTGYATFAVLKQIIPYIDLFLFDLKHHNNSEHIKYTGVPLKPILDNLKLLLEADKKIWLRIPIIPKINNSEKDISGFINLLNNYKKPELVCLLPYHNSANTKYKNLGVHNSMKSVKNLKTKDVELIKKQFEKSGYKVQIGG